MYFPYLFDKQSELLALRSLAGRFGHPQQIIPIIEPVNAVGGLVRWSNAFKKTSDQAYVIDNPHLLTLADTRAFRSWQSASAGLFADADVIRPAYKERAGVTVPDIAAFVARYPGRDIGLVVTTSQLPAVDIAAAVRNAKCLVFATSGADRVSLVSQLGAGRVVEVNDRFPAKARNADYSGEEWFSRDHLDFAGKGHAGFSDYTVLPSKPNKPGGGSVGAVAAHLTFEAADGSVWIEHFVSDEQEVNVGTVGGKLLEACAHIEAMVLAQPRKFDASPALSRYRTIFATGSESSLGKNKELEIAHHLVTIARRLGI